MLETLFALTLTLTLTTPSQDTAKPPVSAPKRATAPAQVFAEGAPIPKLQWVRMLPELALLRPIQSLQLPTDPTHLYIVEQAGRILMVDANDSGSAAPTIVLDIKARVNDGGNEEGLLSVAFSPDFPTKKEVYLYYTANKPRRSILSRFAVSADGITIDPASEEVLITQAQPYSNHNGGSINFGPDGFLYLSLGDGGAADDPHHNSQSMSTFLGKVLRIDVSRKGDDGAPYAIPADNPFVATAGAKPEIWALGLRNIWRMAFDSKTGLLWAGDVGQNIWEEIDIIEKGGNYGWNAREGAHDFTGGKGVGPFKEPVIEYHHREGVSVTGGRVYRGAATPELDGVYVYADFQYGTVWGIRMIDGAPTKPVVLTQKRAALIASIDALNDGTLIVTAFDGGQERNNSGSIWKLIAEK